MTARKITDRPLFSFGALVVFVGAAVFLIATGHADTAWFLPLIVTSVPSLIAAIASETAVRDIRNGTVVAKAKEGASQAIAESQVLTRTGPVVTAELTALQEILQEVKSTAKDTNEKVDDVRQAVADQDARTADGDG